MSTILDRVVHNFSESIQAKINAADTITQAIVNAGEKITHALLEGHKIISCGNSSSARDAAHFTAKMLHHFKQERPGLPAITLNSDTPLHTGIPVEQYINDAFAKQIRALGQAGDVLLIFTAYGVMTNIINAIKAAQDKNISIIALTGQNSGKIADFLTEQDIEVCVPATEGTRIQETHLLIIHCLCDIVDSQLFGHGDTNV